MRLNQNTSLQRTDRHDEAKARISELIDMPNHLVQSLIFFIRQNDGTLSKGKREEFFSALTDDEVQKFEEIVRDVFEGFVGNS